MRKIQFIYSSRRDRRVAENYFTLINAMVEIRIKKYEDNVERAKSVLSGKLKRVSQWSDI